MGQADNIANLWQYIFRIGKWGVNKSNEFSCVLIELDIAQALKFFGDLPL